MLMALIALLGALSAGPGVPRNQAGLVGGILPSSYTFPIASGTAGGSTIAGSVLPGQSAALTPAATGSFATPAPASVADQPPLRRHEVFGFAPYWSLPQSSAFDLNGMTTVDYFSVGINPDGSIDETGAGWQGFQSQNLIDLIDRAHAAGDRVVLTVNDFSQSSLDQLTSSLSTPSVLARSILLLVKAKSLDGVNLDLEGQGSEDQAGLTNLVHTVSQTLHESNPNYQVTLDTYASSAGDPSGFYDISALNQYVNGFFVMAYQLNLHASAGDGSPLTSSMFSNQTTAQQYAAAVPASKVILGLPFFGYDWPTNNGTLGAAAVGSPSIITSGRELSSGRPLYWDDVTDTAWTSYEVGGQWHEAFFEDPQSLYLAARLAVNEGLGGVGSWALGMDGSSDTAMVDAMDGNAPAQKDTLAGPTSTSASVGIDSPQPANGPVPTSTTTTTPLLPSTPAPAANPAATTTTSTAPSYTFLGSWLGAPIGLAPVALGTAQRTLVGTMTDFLTDDPSYACLNDDPSLSVYSLGSDASNLYVITRKSTDCVAAAFVFPNPDPGTASPPSSTTTSIIQSS